MQPDMWDISPHINLLRSIRASQRVKYESLIGEAVDNSFDANARVVRIGIEPDNITFVDDGSGITLERMHALFSLGEHVGSGATLGRFGVGIKSQAILAGDMFSVETVSLEGKLSAAVDWHKLLKSGKWEIPKPLRVPYSVGSPTGAIISIAGLRKTRPVDIWKASEQLRKMFNPALTDGRKIYVNGVELLPISDPEMTDLVDVRLSLSGGRGAHLRAGILAQLSNLNKVHVEYQHRTIMIGALGCGEYSGLTRMFARLRITGPWTLGTFKDDLPNDAERDELEEAVEAALKPILLKVSNEHMDAKIGLLEGLLNDSLPAAMQARPKKKQELGRIGPKRGNQGEVEKEKATPSDGPARSKRPPNSKLIITFDGVYEDHGVGSFDPTSRPCRVNLSKGDPQVKFFIDQRDEEFGRRALYILAMCLYENGRRGGELELGDFGMRISKLLGVQDYARIVVGRV